MLNIVGSSRDDRGIIALLHSAHGVRFLHLFRTVVQDDTITGFPIGVGNDIKIGEVNADL